MRNHKRGLPVIYKKTHQLPSLQMCFFIGYSLLLKIMQIAIIKVKARIVTRINEKNNMYKIAINVDSIISLTSLVEANHICLFSFQKYYKTAVKICQ